LIRPQVLHPKSFPIDHSLIIFSQGVRLSPLGTAVTVWPIVPVPDDRWWWLWSSRWNVNWQGNPTYSEKTCPSATLSTANPTWPDPGSNPDHHGGKLATNRLSYGMALSLIILPFHVVHSLDTDRDIN
jgi:hypothetical protein